jgi:hypothetical protein
MRGQSKHKLPDEIKLRIELKREMKRLRELENMFPDESQRLNVIQDSHKN